VVRNAAGLRAPIAHRGYSLEEERLAIPSLLQELVIREASLERPDSGAKLLWAFTPLRDGGLPEHEDLGPSRVDLAFR